MTLLGVIFGPLFGPIFWTFLLVLLVFMLFFIFWSNGPCFFHFVIFWKKRVILVRFDFAKKRVIFYRFLSLFLTIFGPFQCHQSVAKVGDFTFVHIKTSCKKSDFNRSTCHFRPLKVTHFYSFFDHFLTRFWSFSCVQSGSKVGDLTFLHIKYHVKE